MSARDEALERVREAGSDFVYLQFTDILGSVKGVSIPTSRLERAFDEGVWFDGSSVEGWARLAESDLYLRPDPTSLALFGWESPAAARFICDVVLPDGQPYLGDPRQALRRALGDASAASLDYRVSAEMEFFLFVDRASSSSLPMELARGLEPSDPDGYYSLPRDRVMRLCQDVARTLEGCGFAVEGTHHEVAPGQHEIDLGEHGALRAADAITTLKLALRACCRREGLLPTFMPKPLAGVNGSGLHLQQVLLETPAGRALFYSPQSSEHLSRAGQAFVAGQLAHARGMCALLAPAVNSYKRLVGGGEAPALIDWAHVNRGALIRVPRLGGDGQRLFVELRAADPSCNPYLALAVALKAGMDGLANELEPPRAMEERDGTEPTDEREADPLPSTLGEAIDEMQWDPVVRSVLGETIYERFLAAKEREWAAYREHISLWELESYLQGA